MSVAQEMSSIMKFKKLVGSFIPCFPESVLSTALTGKAGEKYDVKDQKVQRSCLTATWAAAAYGAYLEGDNPRAGRYLESALTLYRGCFDVTTSETVWALIMLALVHDFLGASDKLRLYTGFADVIYRTSDTSDPALPVCIQFLKTLAYLNDARTELEPAVDHNIQRKFASVPVSVLILHQVNCAVRSCPESSDDQRHLLQNMMDQFESTGGYSSNPIGCLLLHALYARSRLAPQTVGEAISALMKVQAAFIASPELICSSFTWRLLHGTAHMLLAASKDASAAISLLDQKGRIVGIEETPNKIAHPFFVDTVERMKAATQSQRMQNRRANLPKVVSTPMHPPQPDYYLIQKSCSNDSASTEVQDQSPSTFLFDDLGEFFLPSTSIKRESAHVTPSEDMPAMKRAYKMPNYGNYWDDTAFSCFHPNGSGFQMNQDQLTGNYTTNTNTRYHDYVPDLADPMNYGSTQVNVIDEPIGLPHAFNNWQNGDGLFGTF